MSSSRRTFSDSASRRLISSRSSGVRLFFATVSEQLLNKAAKGKDHLTTENLREALLTMPPPKKGTVPNEPTPDMLVRGLFRGEIGYALVIEPRDGKEPLPVGLIWAEPAARYPVLLYSHGLMGSPLSGEYLQTIVLYATFGFVVVAPFHADGRFADR